MKGNRRFDLPVVVAVVTFSLFAGCQSLSGLAPDTDASIYVSRPQVFTRERLLNARLQESRWLATQLDRPVQPSFQGFVDERVFRGFYERAQAEFRPLSGAVDDAALREQARSVRRQSEIEELKHQLDLLKLQQDLAVQQSKSSQSGPQFTGAAQPPSNAELATLRKDVNDLAAQVRTLKSSDVTLGLGTITKPALPDPSTVGTTRAQLTSKEIFEDVAAYRDLVNSRMRERQLDDAHDLYGSTIYELKFDVTLAPGDSSRRYAVISFKIDPTTEQVDQLFDYWIESVRYDINAESLRHQQRAQANQLSIEQLLRTYGELIRSRKGSKLDQLFGALARIIGADPRHRVDLLQDPTNVMNLKLAAATAVQVKYERLLGNFIQIGEPTVQTLEGQEYWVMTVTETDNGAEKFKGRLQKLKVFEPFVANIEPKEYAQNISEVAAREALTNLVLSLGATLPQGISLSSYTQYVKDSQTLLNAIKRQPLAVSYSHEGPFFGWLIGPKFTISRGSAVFVHTPARYTFTVSLVVPAWWGSVFLSGTSAWLDKNGKATTASNLWPTATWDCGSPPTKCIRIVLPPRYSALTAAVISSDTSLPRTPELFVERTDKMMIRANSGRQSVLVRGLELWRNPEVFIGSQRADKVELLPDMGGVIATFEDVRIPPRRDQGAPAVDLTIATSFGVDTLKSVVVILPPESGEQGRPFAHLVSTFVEGKGDLKFNVDPVLTPRYYHSLALRVRTLGAQEWIEVPSSPRFPTATELVVPMTFDPPAAWGKPPYELVTNLRLRANPADDPRSVVLENVVYFADASQRSGRLTPGSLTFEADRATPGSLSIVLPQNLELIYKTYPGLRQSLSGGGKLELVLRDSQSGVLRSRLTVDVKAGARTDYTLMVSRETLNGRRDEFVPEQKEAATETKYKVTLAFTSVGGSPQEVPVVEELTVRQEGKKKN